MLRQLETIDDEVVLAGTLDDDVIGLAFRFVTTRTDAAT
jgi:hypothetical protein